MVFYYLSTPSLPKWRLDVLNLVVHLYVLTCQSSLCIHVCMYMYTNIIDSDKWSVILWSSMAFIL